MQETQQTKTVWRGKWPELKLVRRVETLPPSPASPVSTGAPALSPQADPEQAGRLANWLKHLIR
jgi:hypothetical protein